MFDYAPFLVFRKWYDGQSSQIRHLSVWHISKTTRKPSCRWQNRATLAKSLHGLRESSWVVSCIASLPIDSVPMVSYYVLYSSCVCKMRRFVYGFLLPSHSNFVSKMHRFRDMTTYWSKIAEKPNAPSFGTFLWGDPLRIFRPVIPCQKLESWGYQLVYISRSCFRSAIAQYRLVTDRQTDGQTDTSLSQRPALAQRRAGKKPRLSHVC